MSIHIQNIENTSKILVEHFETLEIMIHRYKILKTIQNLWWNIQKLVGNIEKTLKMLIKHWKKY